MANQLSERIARLNRAPAPIRIWLISKMLGHTVKLLGTTKTRIVQLTPQHSEITIRNLRRNRNHIGGVHACAMALAAETATGLLIGMHVADDSVPVIKSMHVDFNKRAYGDITAKAYLTYDQCRLIQKHKKGEVTVSCLVQDEHHQEPVQVVMVWAWVEKIRSAKVEPPQPQESDQGSGLLKDQQAS